MDRYSFNRTFLVLKPGRALPTRTDSVGFNRTFLVLKRRWRVAERPDPHLF